MLILLVGGTLILRVCRKLLLIGTVLLLLSVVRVVRVINCLCRIIGLVSLEHLAVRLHLPTHRLYPLIMLGPLGRRCARGEALSGQLTMKAGFANAGMMRRLNNLLIVPLVD